MQRVSGVKHGRRSTGFVRVRPSRRFLSSPRLPIPREPKKSSYPCFIHNEWIGIFFFFKSLQPRIHAKNQVPTRTGFETIIV